jgi:hypothetical protein
LTMLMFSYGHFFFKFINVANISEITLIRSQ